MPRSLPWKGILAAVLVAEVVALCLVAFAQRSPSADGLVIRTGDASIQAGQQSGPWEVLALKQVTTPVPAWVVVQARGTSRNSAGALLGYIAVPAGVSKGVLIHLDLAQADINNMVVSLVADRGKLGVLEYTPTLSTSAGGGMGGGMGGGGGAKSASSVSATASVDKPLLAQGNPVSIVMRETYRSGMPGTVQRSVAP